MQNDIRFNRGEGGLGRPLAGEDHISGFLSFMPNASLPAGFSQNSRIKTVHSIEEAESLGIVNVTGTPQEVAELHYQLDSAFQVNNGIIIHVGIYPPTGDGTVETPWSVDLSVIKDIQRFADGKIRQLAAMNNYVPFVVGQLVTLQSACDILEAEHRPLSVLYSAPFQGIASSALPDLRAQDAKNVSVIIGRDSTRPVATLGYYSSCLGLALGATSLAKVNESIAWVAKFNANDNEGNNFDVPALTTTNGELIKMMAETALDSINDKGYIFLKKHIGIAGTYFNESSCAKALTSDYAYIENNRTIDKAVRNIRTFLLPSLNAPLYVNQNGTLTEDTTARFRNDALRGLDSMLVDAEISACDVIIDPTQNVLSSSKLVITVKIIPVGVARNIVVNIGFAVKLTN